MQPLHKADIAAIALALTLAAVLAPWFLEPGPPAAAALEAVGDAPIASEAVAPLPPAPELPADKLALGERLFADVRLSRDDSIACITCHDLKRGGVDRQKVSIGVGGAVGAINAPTVFNSGFSFAQFWDGRAASLEEQAAGPIHNPIEMNSDWPQVLAKLRADPAYAEEFARCYRNGIAAENVADAIATFERSLVTPDARFDRYLRGERNAMTPLEIHGYRRFRELGCTSCHQGILLGGNMFQKFGVLRDYFTGRPTTPADLGRYNVTKREEDRHVFKVPSLRNVAVTAPYFHDASAADLAEAVGIMGRHQLGRELASADIEAIVAFLRTLTGQWRGKPLE